MVLAADGWSKASLGKMLKLDSFLKESMRLADGALSTCPVTTHRPASLLMPPSPSPLSSLLTARAVNLFRKAVKDVTLSDGTRIPRGTLVAAAAVTAHSDDARYGPDALAFDPFRFARLREGGGADAVLKHQLVNTSVDFITFGHGKHAWCVGGSAFGVCAFCVALMRVAPAVRGGSSPRTSSRR